MVGKPWKGSDEQRRLLAEAVAAEQRAQEVIRLAQEHAAEIRRASLIAAIEGDVPVKALSDELKQTRKTIYRHAGHDM